jgi:hypothetical protein
LVVVVSLSRRGFPSFGLRLRHQGRLAHHRTERIARRRGSSEARKNPLAGNWSVAQIVEQVHASGITSVPIGHLLRAEHPDAKRQLQRPS